MKSLLVKLEVILVGFSIFTYAEGWGADWKYYAENELGKYYYDAESVKRLSNNIVSVWVMEISSQKSVIDAVNRFGKRYSDLGQMNILWEIDCIGKKSRVLEVLYYSKSKSLISATSTAADSQRAEWKFIIPDSMAEFLSKAVCK